MKRTLYGPDHEAYRDTVREFLSREVVPHHEDWDRERWIDPAAFARAAKAGIYALQIPAEYGGAGEPDYRYRMVVCEEIARVNTLSFGVTISLQDDLVLHYLLDLTNDEQKQRWLPGFAAGELIDEDPEAALAHAQAARARSGRIAAVREAVGVAAYHCGDWAQALSEFRAARRMGSKSQLLPLIADCERGVGRPERAIELARSAEAAELGGDDADEMRIVAAGARADLGQLDQALALLSSPLPDPARTGTTAARLFYAYAETLLALGRGDDALQWFIHAAAADLDGVTDAEDRVSELA